MRRMSVSFSGNLEGKLFLQVLAMINDISFLHQKEDGKVRIVQKVHDADTAG